MMGTVTAPLAGWQRKGNEMEKEPTDFQVFLMALIFAPLLYVLLWLSMALF
jgi:hypothetical protein